MTKMAALFGAFVIGLTYALAAPPVKIKEIFEPEKTYRQTTITRMESKMEFFSPEDDHFNFSELFGEIPFSQEATLRMETTTRTGKIDSEGNIPLTMFLFVPESVSEELNLLSGSMVFGTFNSNGRLVLDSLVNDRVPKETTQPIMELIKTIADQSDYPSESFEIGETIDTHTTMAFPIGNDIIDISIVTEYTLKSIDNGLAFFDLSFNGDFAGIILTMPDIIYGDYSGKGSFQYDTENKRVVQATQEMNSVIEMNYGEIVIRVQQKLTIEQSSRIARQ